ncbi:hypothetical protein O6H91_01G012000 [Diphasiastrum complanatum]|uniref:Uncharacterized protein n=1 Tax=Diphasiastrum complanatum TaxID=34168 RepID=A0ACC2EN56_DIPCM|nr:hypothetical protein O6H91_01G012000 [Diphasiastrum complanatum]
MTRGRKRTTRIEDDSRKKMTRGRKRTTRTEYDSRKKMTRGRKRTTRSGLAQKMTRAKKMTRGRKQTTRIEDDSRKKNDSYTGTYLLAQTGWKMTHTWERTVNGYEH